STFDTIFPTTNGKINRKPAIAPIATITTIVPEKVKPAVPLIPKVFTEFSTEIIFSKGTEAVPHTAKTDIKKMFERARKVGKIYSAKIISWGDQPRPAKKKHSLSSSQLKLVEDRNDNLEAFLERLDLQMNVNKISMAEKPEVMDELLSHDDRILKKHLEFIKVPNASKSIVMFMLKKNRE
ncbi:MAG: hypothetical protein H0V66_02570, partial [Bdellovibrionales bacterium]|nr:hypothetical protein [Bdellovibrionales bacterium]